MAKTWFGKYINFLGKFFTMGAYKGNIADEINKALKGAEGKYLGTNLTPAEEQANEFSHNEAELAYQRQREFYQDFQSPSAMVSQYREAGLNPALMFGNGSPSSGVIGSSAPSSVEPSTGDIGQLVSLMAGLGFRAQEVKAEKLLKGEQANYFKALAKSTENENSVFAERYEFWKMAQTKNLAEIDSKIFLNNSYALLNEQGIKESEAREVLLNYQGLIAKQDAEDQKRMNQILYEVRESARDLNQATAFNATSQGLESQRRLDEAKDTYALRYHKLEDELRKLAADAGISESEFKAFWGDKRLNELLVMSEIYENYKQEFRGLGIGGSMVDWASKRGGTASNVYGLPSLAQPGIF